MSAPICWARRASVNAFILGHVERKDDPKLFGCFVQLLGNAARNIMLGIIVLKWLHKLSRSGRFESNRLAPFRTLAPLAGLFPGACLGFALQFWFQTANRSAYLPNL